MLLLLYDQVETVGRKWKSNWKRWQRGVLHPRRLHRPAIERQGRRLSRRRSPRTSDSSARTLYCTVSVGASNIPLILKSKCREACGIATHTKPLPQWLGGRLPTVSHSLWSIGLSLLLPQTIFPSSPAFSVFVHHSLLLRSTPPCSLHPIASFTYCQTPAYTFQDLSLLHHLFYWHRGGAWPSVTWHYWHICLYLQWSLS